MSQSNTLGGAVRSFRPVFSLLLTIPSESTSNTITALIDAPLEREYTYNVSATASSISWSPCGSYALLNVNTDVGVQIKSGGPATLWPDLTDGWMVFGIGIQWRAC